MKPIIRLHNFCGSRLRDSRPRGLAATIASVLLSGMSVQAQSVIYTPAEDAAATYDSILAAEPADPYQTRQGTATILNVGRQGASARFHQAAVFPFQLPTLEPGASFGIVSFQFNMASETINGAQNCDLYGLAARDLPDVLPGATITSDIGDFYMGGLEGAAEDDPTVGVTKLQDNILVNGEPSGLKSTDSTGSAALAAYLNEQYADGANAGKWVFLRLSLDATPGGQRYVITTSEGAAGAPEEPDLRPQITYTLAGDQVDTIQLETLPDGTGTVIPDQDLAAGETFTAYAIARDSGGTFIENTSVSWSLENLTGGVGLANLDVAADLKSATFSATLVGSGDLVVTGNTSNPISPIAITVAAGPATQVFIEDAFDGTGSPITDQTLFLDDFITVFAISRDAGGNFIDNVIPVWSLENITGEVSADNLIDFEDGSADFEAVAIGSATIRATFADLTPVDSGVITVEELVSRWEGVGGNSNWETVENWAGSVLPEFTSETDLFFFNNEITRLFTYLGSERTVRSITFDEATDKNLTVSYVEAGNATPANLIFDTDSETDPAAFTVAEASQGDITFGFFGPTEAGRGVMILADDLLVSHDGFGTLTMNGDIEEIDGPKSLTKAGEGVLVISGANSYTGDTTITAGTLRVTGESIDDSTTLVVEGGVVDVTADELVAGLTLGGVPQPEGVYGGSESAAPVPDDTNFSGTGTIIVGEPPIADEIVITDIARTGTEVTLTFTSTSDVDVYRSADLTSWGDAYATNQPTGSYTDTAADGTKYFYILVSAGDPGP